MSLPQIAIVAAILVVAVFTVGALVYRNNAKKIERELARLKAEYEEYKSKLASLKG